MQIELLDRKRWTTRVELSVAIADYIGFYNADRRHSSLGYLTPNEHDHLHSTDHLARSS
jgi:putative transposase